MNSAIKSDSCLAPGIHLQALGKPYLLNGECSQGQSSPWIACQLTHLSRTLTELCRASQEDNRTPALQGPGRASMRAGHGFHSCHLEQALKNIFFDGPTWGLPSIQSLKIQPRQRQRQYLRKANKKGQRTRGEKSLRAVGCGLVVSPLPEQ